MKVLLISSYLFSISVFGQVYHFVAIDSLIEQEIGAQILPKIYAHININITITPLPGKRAEYEAVSGNFDGEIMRIFSYGIKNKNIYRVPTPYYQLETMVFTKVGSQIVIKNKEDLSNYVVAKVRGVIHTDDITKGLTNVVDLNSTQQMMKFIELGRADVGITNTLDGIMTLKELNITNIKPSEEPLVTQELYHYVHEKNKHLVATIDNIIIKMKSNGELNKLVLSAEKLILSQKSL